MHPLPVFILFAAPAAQFLEILLASDRPQQNFLLVLILEYLNYSLPQTIA